MTGLCCYTSSFAQTDAILENSDIRPFTASGSIGLSANAYTASGISNRRAPASAKTTANLSFNVFGFSSGINLLYSTDQSQFRQNINTISFNATWNWLTVQAGDVSPNFSEYGINGATIRGGHVKVEPGKWLLELSGGQSKRRVEVSPKEAFREPSFQRMAYAGKIGYGEDNDSHIFLSSHYSIDKNESLEDTGTLTPQENLTVTTDAKVYMFDEIVSLATQVTASAYTRDLNSTKIPIGALSVPGIFGGLVQARQSSRVNYAGQATATVSLDRFGLELGYERIQPGFTSLGVGRVRDDQQRIRLSPSAQFFDNRLSVQSNVVLGRDNLLDNRLQTQKNTNVGTNVQYQVTDMISVNGNYNLLVNNFSSNFDAASAPPQGVALDRTQKSHTITLQPNVTIQSNEQTHNIAVSGSYFSLSSVFENTGTSMPVGVDSDTYSSSLSYSLSFPSGLAINAMSNYLKNTSNASQNTSIGGNVGATYSLFDRKLTLNLNTGINQNKSESGSSTPNQSGFVSKSRQLMFNLTSNYRLTDKDSFSVSVRGRNNNLLEGGSNTYSELEGSFNYRHRF